MKNLKSRTYLGTKYENLGHDILTALSKISKVSIVSNKLVQISNEIVWKQRMRDGEMCDIASDEAKRNLFYANK